VQISVFFKRSLAAVSAIFGAFLIFFDFCLVPDFQVFGIFDFRIPPGL
jgi:hypothetical protein